MAVLFKFINKKSTNWGGQAKRRATQLENAAVILYVISGDLVSNCARFFPGWTRFMYIYAEFNYILQPTGNS